MQVALSHTSFYGYEYGNGPWVWRPTGFCFEMGEEQKSGNERLQ